MKKLPPIVCLSVAWLGFIMGLGIYFAPIGTLFSLGFLLTVIAVMIIFVWTTQRR